jgi:hypothetical protein
MDKKQAWIGAEKATTEAHERYAAGVRCYRADIISYDELMERYQVFTDLSVESSRAYDAYAEEDDEESGDLG